MFKCLRNLRNGALLAALWMMAAAAPAVGQQPATPVEPPLTITNGAHVLLLGDAIATAERSDAAVELLLRRSFPERRLSVDTLDQPGDVDTLTSRPADLAAFKEQLASRSPTLVLVGVSVADNGKEDQPAAFRDGLSQLVDAVADTKATVILITPRVDGSDGAPARSEAFAKVTADVAAERSLRYVDLTEVSPLRAALAGSDASPYAQLTHALARLPGLSLGDWRVDIDVVRRRQTSRGTSVTSLSATPAQVTFTAHDDVLPESGDGGSRRVMRVRGLAPGRYTLRIDNEIAATAREGEWSRGVTIHHGPDFDQADALAAAVRRKNRAESEGTSTSGATETELSQLSRTQSHRYKLSVD